MFSVAVRGAVLTDMRSLLARLAQELKAELVVISDDDETLALAQTPLRLPGGIPEWASPLVSIVPAQLFSYHLTRVKGWDTEKPRGLRKVTETR